MPTHLDVSGLTDAVQSYFDLMYDSDVTRFDRVFRSTAQLHGFREGQMTMWPAATFKEMIAGRPSPQSQNAPRAEEILLVDFASADQALVKVRVRINTVVFVDYLTYHRIDGDWLITAKGLSRRAAYFVSPASHARRHGAGSRLALSSRPRARRPMNKPWSAPTDALLPCQRALFDIPREVCFLNAASWSPLPLASQEAGRIGVARKGQPWKLGPDFAPAQHERARVAAANLINADAEDVALISSVSYGVATAAKLVTVPAGARALVLEDDHSSPVLEWMTRAPQQGFTVEVVRRRDDGDWTAAVLAAIERRGAPPLALVSISSVHWSDGGLVDLDAVAPATRAAGAALLIDATHSAGVLALDVRALDPDFLVFPTYKWVLGPYGRAFLYIAKRRQDGMPLEQTSYGRRAVAAGRVPYFTDTAYVTGARRFDMGERDHFISLEMAAIGMELMARWGSAAVVPRLRMLTDRLAAGLVDCGVTIATARVRAPHILSLSFPHGMPERLFERLAAEHVHVAPRLGRLRISPHVYNDETDIDRFVATFRNLMA